MTQEDYRHPIAPPPELVQQLIKQIYGPENGRLKVRDIEVATFFARWGADQELDGCFEEINTWGAVTSYGGALADDLRSARRSKPPSLKQVALLAIDVAVADERLSADVADVVRRALEALPE